MNKKYPMLLSPGSIGKVELKNRIVMSAMGMNQSDDGFVNDTVIEHYTARARGGAGLIIVEVTCVVHHWGKIQEIRSFLMVTNTFPGCRG